MSCAEISELLPWYLNGSLEPDQHREVERHLAECEACARLLAETGDAFEVFGQHLPADWLIDLADETATPSFSRELADRHLESCDRCRRELAMVRGSFAALESTPRPAADVVPLSRPTGVGTTFNQRWALAASLVALLGLSGWLWSWRELDYRRDRIADLESRMVDSEGAGDPSFGDDAGPGAAGLEERILALQDAERTLRQDLLDADRERARLATRLSEAARPQLNAPVVDLFPGELVQRGSGDASSAVEVPFGLRSVTLILNSQLGPEEPASGLQLSDSAGKVLWRLEGLRRNPTGDFTLTLPTADLARGIYSLSLVARRDGETVILEVYRVRVS